METAEQGRRPNIILILNDDMGFSDLGCYGGEIRTPNLDRLATGGLRFTQFYNTARCCPSRASLLTGLHPHQAGVGHMMGDLDLPGYRGDLTENCMTIAEMLKGGGYATVMSGKWHVSRHLDVPKDNWPLQRGFDRFWGTITGAGSYFDPATLTEGNERIPTPEGPFYYTDAISDHAVSFVRDHFEERSKKPLFAYVAYTAPHWPLQAPQENIATYRGRFDAGWDILRDERLGRMRSMGLLESDWELSPRDPDQPPWDEVGEKAWQLSRMEVYAAQIDRMDQGIGRILETLEAAGELDNTLIVFLSDNGGCAEELHESWLAPLQRIRVVPETARDGSPVAYGNEPSIRPGNEHTYQSYGVPWANLSNAPFRLYKHWVHEGGIATPLIVHWPSGIPARGELRHEPAQLPDIMATFAEASGAPYPAEKLGQRLQALEGSSLVSCFGDGNADREGLFWEHEGNRAVRRDHWKLVCRFPGAWELFDMERDRTEMHDLAERYPSLVRDLTRRHHDWSLRCQVVPWEQVLRRLG